MKRSVKAAGQDGRACLARAARHGRVPLGVVDEVARHGGLGPDQEIEPRRCPEALGQAEQPAEHAVLAEAVPLLAVALVRLHQSDHADIPHGQRAHPPRAVAEREENGPQHGPHAAPPPPPTPPPPPPPGPGLHRAYRPPTPPPPRPHAPRPSISASTSITLHHTSHSVTPRVPARSAHCTSTGAPASEVPSPSQGNRMSP